jgi:hypothetical protein
MRIYKDAVIVILICDLKKDMDVPRTAGNVAVTLTGYLPPCAIISTRLVNSLFDFVVGNTANTNNLNKGTLI